MKLLKTVLLSASIIASSIAMAQQGPEDFPPLKFADIPGAPKLQKPFLVMGETKPVMGEKHGLAGPAFWDWNSDGLKDLLIGEFETTSEEYHGDKGSTIKVYLNVGTKEAPKFTDEWFYARDTYGVALEVNQWCCIGFTPQFVDLDDDGNMDIITGQYHPGDVYWFRGQQGRGFAKGIPLKQEGNPWSAINSFDPRAKTADPIETFEYWVYSSANMGDLDGDGDYDLITGGSDITVSENIGTKKSPEFGRRNLLLDTNGKPLKVRTLNEKSLMRLKQYGRKPTASGAQKTQQLVVDWDNDGVLDILSTDEYLTDEYNAVTFFKGVKGKNGEMQRFQPGISLFDSTNGSKPFPGSGQRVYVDDWNNDGVNDLIVGASIVTVDGKFHSKMSWEYESDLGIPSAGKDYGRYPEQFNIPTFEEFLKGPMRNFVKGKTKEEQKTFYDQQSAFIKQGLEKLKKDGVPDAVKMIHKGYIYVFLGKK